MAGEEYDPKIQDAERRKAAIGGRMDALAERAMAEVVAFLPAWIDNRARAEVEREADKTNALGLDGVKALRADLSAFKGELPERVQQAFAALWVQRKQDWSAPAGYFGLDNLYWYSIQGVPHPQSHPSDAVNGALRKVVTPVEQRIQVALSRRDQGRGLTPTLPESAKAILMQLADLYDEYVKVDLERQGLVEAQAKVRALSLWDQAE